MTYDEAKNLISKGEGIDIEFKKSTVDITKDVYETVCAFSNRFGGHIFLGVKDDGTVIGVDKNCIEKIKKNFVTSINNPTKFYPLLYLQIEDIIFQDKYLIHIYVPENPQVCRCGGKIYDRNNDSDVDITNSGVLVFNFYSRKQGKCFVDNVLTQYNISDLRTDVIERARRMSRARNKNHPWLTMTDEELLRSVGLIARESNSNKDGITLAAILLFGKDEIIASALPQYKTDAIFRVENLDRYDDRDVIITNLFDTFDRLMNFGKKHLSDPFLLEGVQAVSARDAILREIFSNSLAHRDYSTGYVAKFVIEKDKMFTENGNVSHGNGELELNDFKPFSKNPVIAKVFREVSLADELGSGMRNTFKYTKLYSGGTPEFIEGDVFKIIIPLSKAATEIVGPQKDENTQVSTQVSTQGEDVFEKILDFCEVPRTKKEITEYFNLKNAKGFGKRYLTPLISEGKLKMTIPEKPTSSKQKYISVSKS